MPRIVEFLRWVLFIFSMVKGATAVILTLGTAVNQNKKEMADRVERFPAQLCSGDGSLPMLLFHYFCPESIVAFFVRFLYLFSLFFLSVIFSRVPLSSWFCFVHAAVICSSARTCSSCILLIFWRHSFLSYFRISVLVRFFVLSFFWRVLLHLRTRYVGTSFAYLSSFPSILFFSLLQSLTT